LMEGADELFADGRRRGSAEVDEQELYEQIGRLQMELAWLKKKVAQVE
jgi:transposase